MNQRMEGSKGPVTAVLAAAGTEFAEGIQPLGLKLSSKSVVIASDPQIASNISRILAAKGFTAKPCDVAPDLGIDRGNVRRSKPKATKRFQAAMARTQKIKSISVAKRSNRSTAVKLHLTGAMPGMP